MVITQKSNPTKLSLGLYVKFAETDDRNSAIISSDGPFRKHVVLYLKDRYCDSNLATLLYLITEVENGAHFPIRFDWENVKPFFSFAQIQRLAHALGEIPFYLYNAKELDKRRIDIDAIARTHKAQVKRKKYIS